MYYRVCATKNSQNKIINLQSRFIFNSFENNEGGGNFGVAPGDRISSYATDQRNYKQQS